MPATPLLTLVDKADGTGATATVSASTGGSTNDVYAANWSGGMVPAAFTLIGSRLADGTLALALAAGYWWCYCVSSLGGQSAISLVKGLRVTTGADAIDWQSILAAKAKIQALALPAPWLSANVLAQKFPWNRGALSAAVDGAIFVTPLKDTLRPVLNQSDDFAFGIQITAARKSNMDLTANMSAELLCRQQLMNGFLPVAGTAALGAVAEVHDVRIETGPIYDPGSFEQQFDVSAFVLRCINRRTRGLV